MDKTSKWYDPKQKEYICCNCGAMFQFKIGSGDNCMTCLKPLRDEMHKVTSNNLKAIKQANIEFKKRYEQRNKNT